MFFFREIDGQKRKVLLTGGAAPFGQVRSEAAFKLGGKLRKKKTFEPGAKSPAVHTTGTEFAPIEIKGQLRDHLVGRAEQLRQLIESVAEEGRLLQIVWNNRLYVGQLEEWLFPVEGEGQYQYELKFDIYSRGAGEEPLLRTLEAVGSVLSDSGFAAPLKAALGALPTSLLPFDLRLATDALTAGVLSTLSNVIALVEEFESAAADTERVGAELLGQLSTLLQRALACLSFVTRVFDEDLDDAIAATEWRAKQAAAAAAIDEALAQLWRAGQGVETQLSTADTDTPERLYVTREGDTWESIAREFETTFDQLVAWNPEAPIGTLQTNTVLRVA